MDAPFQTMDEVNEYLSGNTIECLICGKRLQRLHKHLYSMHNMGPDDYRRQFGIPFRRSLASEPSRARSRAANTPERIELFLIHGEASRRRKRTGSTKGRVPAIANQWKKNAELGRYFARTQVTTSCAKCGVEVITTALVATQTVHCLHCASYEAQKTRRHYWRNKLAA